MRNTTTNNSPLPQFSDPRIVRLVFATLLFVVATPAFSNGISNGSWGSALWLGVFTLAAVAFLRNVNEKKRELERIESSNHSDV